LRYRYIIYTPNLGFAITRLDQEREQGRFRGSNEGGRGSTEGVFNTSTFHLEGRPNIKYSDLFHLFLRTCDQGEKLQKSPNYILEFMERSVKNEPDEKRL